jgi:hypothetical protein
MSHMADILQRHRQTLVHVYICLAPTLMAAPANTRSIKCHPYPERVIESKRPVMYFVPERERWHVTTET